MKVQSIVGREFLEVLTIRVAIRSTKANNTEFVDHLLLICKCENKGTGKKTSQWPLCGRFRFL
jgi:hypothetical protein